MGNQEESVVFFFPLAIHLPTRLIPLYVPPFPFFFDTTFFAFLRLVSDLSPWTCLCPWLHQILRHATLKKYPNRFDLRILENLKKIFIYSKRAFYHFNQRLAKKARSEIRHLDPIRRNDEMVAYPTTRNALLCETKVSQKWNCNEIRRLFLLTGKIRRDIV